MVVPYLNVTIDRCLRCVSIRNWAITLLNQAIMLNYAHLIVWWVAAMSSLLNFDLRCETALSAFILIVSQASWLVSIIWWVTTLELAIFNISGLLKSLGSHINIVLWDRKRRQLRPLPQWYLYACSSSLASNMSCYCAATTAVLVHSTSLTVTLIITQCMSRSFANIQSASARYEPIFHTCYHTPPQGIFHYTCQFWEWCL